MLWAVKEAHCSPACPGHRQTFPPFPGLSSEQPGEKLPCGCRSWWEPTCSLQPQSWGEKGVVPNATMLSLHCDHLQMPRISRPAALWGWHYWLPGKVCCLQHHPGTNGQCCLSTLCPGDSCAACSAPPSLWHSQVGTLLFEGFPSPSEGCCALLGINLLSAVKGRASAERQAGTRCSPSQPPPLIDVQSS